MKLLLTGVGGYIGSHAARMFLENGHTVVGVDNFSTGFRGAVAVLEREFGKDGFRFHQVDLKDLSSVVTLFGNEDGIDGVVHFAASCSVNESMENPYLYFSNNVQTTLHVLEAMKQFDVKHIVFSSTCATYGTPHKLPVDETHEQRPESPYGESKMIAEQIIKWYGELFSINYVILRYFNVCGAAADGSIGDAKQPSVHLVQNAVRGALGIAPFELLFGKVDTPDGSPVRDYVNVLDLSEAHGAALDYLVRGGKSDVFNIGTGEGNSVLEIIQAVKTITGKDFKSQQGETRKGESARIYADTTKSRTVLGWCAKRSLEDSVASLVKWYTAHPMGWEK